MDRRIVAALFMLLAAAFVAGSSLCAKALGVGGMHPFQISAGRFIFALTVLALASAVLRPHIVKPDLPVHLLRVIFGWLGVTAMFAAVARMPVAEATAITFLNPVVAMVLAIPLLGERVGPWRWAAAAVSLIGALILIRPGTEAFQPAAFIALTAAVLMGVEVIIIKRLVSRERPMQILIINNAIGAVIAVGVSLFVWRAPVPQEWVLMAGTGVLMVCAQTCFLQSMGRADASFVGPVFYSTLVFAALYDALLFGVIPAAAGFAGAGLIIAGGVLMVWRETRISVPEIEPKAG